LTILLIHSHSFAWSGAGHLVIAAEAWRELSTAQKANVTLLLLKSHPDYSKWKARHADTTIFVITAAIAGFWRGLSVRTS
jgi:hypothetical protein